MNSYFEDIIGVTLHLGQSTEHILFWVSNKSKHYVATKPLHESQILYKGSKEKEYREKYPNLKDGFFFSIDCVENYELIRELCSFGPELIVLSPQKVRKDIITRIEEMQNRYAESNKD